MYLYLYRYRGGDGGDMEKILGKILEMVAGQGDDCEPTTRPTPPN